MISERMFNTTCSISRPQLEKSTSGAYGVDANASTYTNLPCSLQIDSGTLAIEEKMRRGLKSGTLFLRAKTPADVAVAVVADDVVTIAGETWKAVGPSIDASAGRGELIRVPVEAPLRA